MFVSRWGKNYFMEQLKISRLTGRIWYLLVREDRRRKIFLPMFWVQAFFQHIVVENEKGEYKLFHHEYTIV